MKMVELPSYVLITPARNEARFIGFTLESVVAQTVRPLKWVIVSDGSTDATDEIVVRYAASHPWIQLVAMPDRRERNFAGKVRAFNAGYAKLRGLPYEVIGSLDSDISFGETYFQYLLEKIAADPSLGLVGTPFEDACHGNYDYRFASIEHVSGACQLFRRECFEKIGGYVPVKTGGVDYISVVTARMKGWKTRTFLEQKSVHHREMGTANGGVVAARFRNGIKDSILGNHPVWEVFRAAYQTRNHPVIVGGIALLAGYAWAYMRRVPRAVSPEFVAFVRHEQMSRLCRLVTGAR